MAGGTGQRFWPQSRISKPKQCLKIINDQKTMLETTIERFFPLISTDKIFISTGKMVEPALRNVLQDKYEFIVEPLRKNTAAAIALSALFVKKSLKIEDEVIAFVGADYHIKEKNIFQETLLEAEKLAKKGYIVTIGINPRYPATGYGYILSGEKLETKNIPAFKINTFKEKPDRKTAEKYIEEGTYYWNSGMFVVSIKTIIQEFMKYSPDHIKLLDEALNQVNNDNALEIAFEKIQSISFDYAIMEKTKEAAVIDGQFYWDDVGSWEAVYDLLQKDENENAVKNAKTLLIDTKNSLVINDSKEKPLITLIGVDSMIVINTGDTILICPKDKAQDVKRAVDILEKQEKKEFL